MRPTLFTIGPVTIQSYGVFLSFSLILALFVLWRLYKNDLRFLRYKLTVDSFFDSVLVFFISFTIGARLLHIIEHFDFFGVNILQYFLFLHFPGFSFLGGIIGGAIGLFLFCWVNKKPFFLLLDLISIGIALALAFSRIGSLLSGDAYGSETNFFLKVEILNLPGLRHPTQLYEAILAFSIFALLYFLYSRRKFRNGELFLVFLTAIGICRFFVEMLRGDSVYLVGFAVAQIISVVFICVGVVFLINAYWLQIRMFFTLVVNRLGRIRRR